MGAAAAPARADRPRPAGQERAADRADRRRQDPGGLPAVTDRAHRAAAGRQDLAHKKGKGELHTLYISPLKALATDIRRNLEMPIAEMALAGARRKPHRRHAAEPAAAPARAAARSPDDHAGVAGAAAELPRRHAVLRQPPLRDHRRAAFLRHQQARPSPGALPGARRHAWRRRCASSACRPRSPIRRPWRSSWPSRTRSRSCRASPARSRSCSIIDAQERLPWGGHMGHHAVPEVYNIIRQHKTSIVFVNTRAQAELVFDRLWRINEENLAIGLHHGSLAVEQRRKVEAAMAAGKLRAVVATSSLDLGIDWGDVDLVIQMGAPKGVSRLMQRIGRANHRLDEPSRAMIAPANRFEVLESLAALEAVEARELDGDPPRPPCLDVLAQHIVGCACAQPIDRDQLYEEVLTHAALPRAAAQGFRRHLRLRRHRRLCAGGLRALAPAEAAARRPLDAGLAPGGAAVPHECRHHRRAAADQGEAEARPHPGRGRGVLHPGPGAGRHLRLRRPHAALRGRQGTHRPVLARDRRRSQGAGLWRRPPAALDVPGRAGARHPAGSVAASQAAARGARMAAHAAHPLDLAGQQSPADRGFSRAAPSSSSSPTASRAGTPTRRWACC